MKNKGLALLFTVLVVQSSCSLRPSRPDFSLNEVKVIVKAEYHEEFINRNITVEDFAWENISELNYQHYYPEYDYGRSIEVSLKVHGVKRVESAIEHFKKLDFIEDAGKVHYLTILRTPLS